MFSNIITWKQKLVKKTKKYIIIDMNEKPDDIDFLKEGSWNINPEKEIEKSDPLETPWNMPPETENKPEKGDPLEKPWNIGIEEEEESPKTDPLESPWEGFSSSAPKTPSEEVRASLMEKMETNENKEENPNIQYFFPDLSPGQNDYLNSHPDFIENPFNLKNEELLKTVEAHDQNIAYLFPGEKINDWENLRIILATPIMERTGLENNPAVNVLSNYLRLLGDFADIKPKTGFMGINSENAEQFIARALQKIKLEGNLEKFEESLHR